MPGEEIQQAIAVAKLHPAWWKLWGVLPEDKHKLLKKAYDEAWKDGFAAARGADPGLSLKSCACGKPIVPPRSEHCSTGCCNKAARDRYTAKKKAEVSK